MRPECVREARDWMMRAEQDLLALGLLMSADPPLMDIAVYHSQQAAEKALKAFLAAHNEIIPRTHVLVPLVTLCRAIEPALSRLEPAARILSPYAIQFRYPGGPSQPLFAEAREAQRLATEVVRFVRSLLPQGDAR